MRRFSACPHRCCVQNRFALPTAPLRRIFARAISYIRRAITQTRASPTWDRSRLRATYPYLLYVSSPILEGAFCSRPHNPADTNSSGFGMEFRFVLQATESIQSYLRRAESLIAFSAFEGTDSLLILKSRKISSLQELRILNCLRAISFPRRNDSNHFIILPITMHNNQHPKPNT